MLGDKPITTKDVLTVLARRHPMDGFRGEPAAWVWLEEVCATTGEWGSQQRFDGVAIGLLPRVKFARVVYEVKVSRSDWLREKRPRTRVENELNPDHDEAALDAAYRRDDQKAIKKFGYWRDVKVPVEGHKWDAAVACSTEFWYAAPVGCIKHAELPPEAGLILIERVHGHLKARVAVQAPVRETVPEQGFWAAVLRMMAGPRNPFRSA